MRYSSTKTTLAGLLCAATLAASLSPALAGPIGAASPQTVSLSAPTDHVYYRRWGGGYGYRRGWGGGGLAAGAALGLLGAGLFGAATAPYYGYGGYGSPYYGTYGYGGYYPTGYSSYPTCSGGWGW